MAKPTFKRKNQERLKREIKVARSRSGCWGKFRGKGSGKTGLGGLFLQPALGEAPQGGFSQSGQTDGTGAATAKPGGRSSVTEGNPKGKARMAEATSGKVSLALQADCQCRNNIVFY